MTLSTDLTLLIRSKPVEAADIDRAALHVLDTAACFVAGTNSDRGRRLLSWAREAGHLTADGLKGDPTRVAFVLGALSHILEIDDLHRGSTLHPGCAVVPALWGERAAAEHPIDGGRALTAVLQGYEAATRVGMAVGPAHYKLWHNTATCGPFGSAMTAAALLELEDSACVDALGNAGTQAAGLWEFVETGAMSKPLHAGRAAEAGMMAAHLAKHGLTGAPAILEGKRGFFAAMCADANLDMVLAEPDAAWQLHATSIKPWPACRHTHSAIDAAQELRRALIFRGLQTSDIEAIEICTYAAAVAVCDNPDPHSDFAGKFSLQHCVAAALVHEEVWFDSFNEDARDNLAPLRARCRVLVSEEIDKRYPESWGSEIRITLADGDTLEAKRQLTKGDPELALDADALIAKASRLLSYGGVAEPMRFIESVLAMREGAPIPPLPRPLGRGARPKSKRRSDPATRSQALS